MQLHHSINNGSEKYFYNSNRQDKIAKDKFYTKCSRSIEDNFRTLLTQMMTLTHGVSVIFLVRKVKIGQS